MKDTEKRLKEKNIELIEDLIKVVSETDVLDTEDVENYYRNADRIINGSAIDNAWKALGLKGKLKELFATSIQEAIAEERARVRGEIEKYSSMEEVVVNGQRFLRNKNDNTIPFGHPYPDTKEKYIVKALLSSLDKPLKERTKL